MVIIAPKSEFGFVYRCGVWCGGMRNKAFRWLAFALQPPPTGRRHSWERPVARYPQCGCRGSLHGRSRRWRPPLLHPCPGGGHGSDRPCGATLDSPSGHCLGPCMHTSAPGGHQKCFPGIQVSPGVSACKRRNAGTRIALAVSGDSHIRLPLLSASCASRPPFFTS